MYEFISIGQFKMMADRFRHFGHHSRCYSCTYDINNIWIE